MHKVLYYSVGKISSSKGPLAGCYSPYSLMIYRGKQSECFKVKSSLGDVNCFSFAVTVFFILSNTLDNN